MSEILKGSFLTDKKGLKMEIVDAEARAKAEENAEKIGELSEGMGNVSWNDLTDKPFEERFTISELIAEQSFVFDVSSGKAYAEAPIYIDFVAGAAYTVTFDGKTYGCICKSINGTPYIGNGGFLGVEDTGEPFVCVSLNGLTKLGAVGSETEHTVALSGPVPDITTLDSKYLPIASKNGIGAIEIIDLPKAYVAVDEMRRAIDKLNTGGARVYWHGAEIISASYETEPSVLYCVLADSPTLLKIYRELADEGIFSDEIWDYESLIDTHRLPNGIPVIHQSVTVGQTLVVKAVDENGKPTEWEAADAGSGGGDSGKAYYLYVTANAGQAASLAYEVRNSNDFDGSGTVIAEGECTVQEFCDNLSLNQPYIPNWHIRLTGKDGAGTTHTVDTLVYNYMYADSTYCMTVLGLDSRTGIPVVVCVYDNGDHKFFRFNLSGVVA